MNKLLILIAALLCYVAFALAHESAADIPPRVEVSPGHRLRMRIEGSGSPAVVLEIGLGGTLEEWAMVQSGVAKFARVAAYDRNGSNYTSQSSLTARQVARDLHEALAKAHIAPPYVLVGQSFGGIYNRVFAEMYPGDIAGMVLLDAPQEKFIDWMEIHHPKEGLASFRTEHWPEAAGMRATLDELKAGGPLPDVPIIVVTAAGPSRDPLRTEILPVWTAMHEDWVKILPLGRHVITYRSGHGIQVEQPDLVIELINEVVQQSHRR